MVTREWTRDEQKAHRAELVAALRSGKFKQARGALRKGDSYCCLGVACKVSKLGKFRPFESAVTGARHDFIIFKKALPGSLIQSSETSLPQAVQDYYGFTSNSGSYTDAESGGYTSLLNRNDDDFWDFNRIADVIEAEPEGLVVK